jgi:hypothetical protein
MFELSREQKRLNRGRAKAAKIGLKAWASGGYVCGSISEREFLEDQHIILGDFLADLQHYCELYGFDFEDALDRARRFYQVETTPEPDDSSSSDSSDADNALAEKWEEGASQTGAAKLDYEAEMRLTKQQILNSFQPNRPTARKSRVSRRERD